MRRLQFWMCRAPKRFTILFQYVALEPCRDFVAVPPKVQQCLSRSVALLTTEGNPCAVHFVHKQVRGNG